MQASKNILLVKPATFSFNTQTAVSNAFQTVPSESEAVIKQKKLGEFEAFVQTLRDKGVNVFVVEDTIDPPKPDAMFPNNWVTFHADGTVVLYPMQAPNRQYERRQDIIDTLKKYFVVTNLIDLSIYEKDQQFLEGTGSIIFDHPHKLAYACLSPRTDKALFVALCKRLQYAPIYFYAHDESGKEIYHTNVMMCIAEQFSVICLDSITDPIEKAMVTQSLSQTGHQVISIGFDQMKQFAGNMLALQTNANTSILALSQTAYNSLTASQKNDLEKYTELVPLNITTIETIGGGSARCMIAEIFLPPIV